MTNSQKEVPITQLFTSAKIILSNWTHTACSHFLSLEQTLAESSEHHPLFQVPSASSLPSVPSTVLDLTSSPLPITANSQTLNIDFQTEYSNTSSTPLNEQIETTPEVSNEQQYFGLPPTDAQIPFDDSNIQAQEWQNYEDTSLQHSNGSNEVPNPERVSNNATNSWNNQNEVSLQTSSEEDISTYAEPAILSHKWMDSLRIIDSKNKHLAKTVLRTRRSDNHSMSQEWLLPTEVIEPLSSNQLEDAVNQDLSIKPEDTTEIIENITLQNEDQVEIIHQSLIEKQVRQGHIRLKLFLKMAQNNSNCPL
ncbi:unnamed protein product [Protopolystoma xenopodis]|uniref:Uncharacterized protein n=1 Tax=Protopolystoma xenopodis TaxID=117903 RepID=A0A448WF74_9PLAT|nr:unnamed protein product [Protopolystoma xenopodis]